MLAVVLTPRHRITGHFALREQRLSDFLNDKHDSVIRLEGATVARLTDSDMVIEERAIAVIHKRGALAVFGLDDPTMTLTMRTYARVGKRTHEVLLAVDALEVRGRLHTSGALDAVGIHQLMTQPGADHFMPVTDAVVSVDSDPAHDIRRDAIMVNRSHVLFIAKEELSPSRPA